MRAPTPWRSTRVVSTLRVGIVDLLPTSSATGRAGSGSASKAASLQGDRLTIEGERKAEREEHERGASVPRGSLRARRVHRAAAGPH
jgi:hypothetical protein